MSAWYAQCNQPHGTEINHVLSRDQPLFLPGFALQRPYRYKVSKVDELYFWARFLAFSDWNLSSLHRRKGVRYVTDRPREQYHKQNRLAQRRLQAFNHRSKSLHPMFRSHQSEMFAAILQRIGKLASNVERARLLKLMITDSQPSLLASDQTP